MAKKKSPDKEKKSPDKKMTKEAADLSGLVTEDDEALIALMQQDRSTPAAPTGTSKGGRKSPAPGKVRASIRAVPERGSVMVALEHIGEPSKSASILLSPNDTLIMVQRLFEQSMALPTPPTGKAIKSALEHIVKTTQSRKKK